MANTDIDLFAETAPKPKVGRPPAPPDIIEEKRRLAKAQREWQEIKNDQAMGALVRAGEVETRWARILADTRAAVLAVPSRVSAQLPQLDLAEIAIIDRELRTALEELVDAAG